MSGEEGFDFLLASEERSDDTTRSEFLVDLVGQQPQRATV